MFDVDGTYESLLRYGCKGPATFPSTKHMIILDPLVSDTV